MTIKTLTELLSTITNWDKLSHKIELSEGKYLRIKDKSVDVCEEIKKVSGLKYKIEKKEAFYNTVTYIVVTDAVGTLIEAYLKTDGFADLELNEFLSEAISDAH